MPFTVAAKSQPRWTILCRRASVAVHCGICPHRREFFRTVACRCPARPVSEAPANRLIRIGRRNARRA